MADSRVTDFGHPAAELAAAASGTILCDLSHLGLIRFEGEDGAAFLQGQLTCDVREIQGRATHGGYCSAKGRLLATFLLWQTEGSHFMQLPGEIREAIQRRLSMFVLRAKVKLSDAGDGLIRMGVAGAGAGAALAAALGSVPAAPLALARLGRVTVIRLDASRFELIAPPDEAPALWNRLAMLATPAGAACWEWLEIRAGVPAVVPATQDQFVPQMANLDSIGAVSFSKGCYPGQEIVARTRYLGKLKRRMFLAHLDADAAPRPGDEIHAPDTAGQAAGTVVSAAPAPGGGFELLAVIQVSSAEAGELHWGSPEGPRLRLLRLPYSME
ncbi:MAG TPA: folate-binding protein [Burkholderiales bacterium]